MNLDVNSYGIHTKLYTLYSNISHKKQMLLGKIGRDNGEANQSVEASISGIFERPTPAQDQVGGPCR